MSRIMFRFWLDDNKEDENALIGEVGELKSNRKFTETIRQGIQLITDLRNGSLEVLFEMFPYVKAEFLEYVGSINQAEKKAVSNERQELDTYKAELDEYRQSLEQRFEQLEQERKKIEEERAIETQKQNAHVTEQLERIENLLLSEGNVPIKTIEADIEQQTPALTGLKPLGGGGVSPLPKPSFDDDDDDLLLTVTKADMSDSNASQNFLSSMMALQKT